METKLRKLINREEFDYPALIAALSEYANPRVKVTRLLRKGVIIRVKKGLYVFGDDYRRRPFSRELLSNLIYGPSFVSLDYALSFHGLIPERVEMVTSVTVKRPKKFITPIGTFTYRHAPSGYFYMGMDRIVQRDLSFLLAIRERALADKVCDDRGNPMRTQRDVDEYLFDNLRINRTEFSRMNAAFMKKLARAAKSHKLLLCAKRIEALKEK